MQFLFAFILHVFHFAYSLVLKIRSFWNQCSPTQPQLLTAHRHRIPKHLAIVFVTDETVSAPTAQGILTESVLNTVKWCRTIGIKKLTVYEETDILSQCTRNIRDCLPVKSSGNDSSESETEFPLTPPPSDYSESRPLSPDHNQASVVPVTMLHVGSPPPPAKEGHKRRKSVGRNAAEIDGPKNDLILCLASREASKPAIAAAARVLAQTRNRPLRKAGRSHKGQPFILSVDQLDDLLEDEDTLSSPDFMIIHHIASSNLLPTPPELHGFPPWHIRLTEIYHNLPHLDRPRAGWNWRSSYDPLVLDENVFRKALDEFASAEMRFGK
ncbi:unnamed protein product [Cyclocybe aegerita]|uniref:ditrans,polycis-polyprenyl diphosphate synthase [(2E,6E)-farnesyldiphosphate specific] n=1 Tax=Cyclocybe aegerita TaxID=1973307 RepID=A0A8S0W0X7_CYCAE|nr:unnamed protein product [Cyclocybe aegerita]